MHHPRSRSLPQFKNPFPSTTYEGFKVGQSVEAQIGGRWGEATVRRVRGAKLTVQFSGAVDVVDVSRTHVRAMAGQESKTNEGLTISPTQTTAKPLSPESRSRCSGGTPPPRHRTPVDPGMSPELQELERLKRAAIEREDYLDAQRLKDRIALERCFANLQRQKTAAVRSEDFLRAQQLKQEIAELRLRAAQVAGEECKIDEAPGGCALQARQIGTRPHGVPVVPT